MSCGTQREEDPESTKENTILIPKTVFEIAYKRRNSPRLKLFDVSVDAIDIFSISRDLSCGMSHEVHQQLTHLLTPSISKALEQR